MTNPILLAPILDQMAADIQALDLERPLMIGIHTGGAWVAEELHRRLELPSPLGTLDISFYRDDFSRVGLNPSVRSSTLPESVDDRAVILVDDVLYTGRTLRAALNEIFSWGRPAVVRLAVALDRPGRELPIQADVVGQRVELTPERQAKIARGEDGALRFDILTRERRGGSA